MVHNDRRPRSTLSYLSLEFYVHCVLWDEYGDEVPVKMRFLADSNGTVIRIDYSMPEDEQEVSISIGQSAGGMPYDE